MLKGNFTNCYGLKYFKLDEINFSKCNKAIIYAPNGAMKTSFANTLEKIKSGHCPEDRIFSKTSSFELQYKSKFCKSGDSADQLSELNLYVIQSFIESKESGDSISTLLVDKQLKSEYEEILKLLEEDIKNFTVKIAGLTGVSKTKVKELLFNDFGLNANSEWFSFFKLLSEKIKGYTKNEEIRSMSYSTIFNPKTIELYQDPKFIKNILKYIEILEELVNNSGLLSKNFDDYKAEQLGKSFAKFDLFSADHFVILKNGSEVKSIKEWNKKFDEEIGKIESDASLKSVYNEINKLLNKNIETLALKELITTNPFLIRYFDNIEELKTTIWLNNALEFQPIIDNLLIQFEKSEKRTKEIYEIANQSRGRWEKIVNDFNNRFLVPFSIRIKNQANVLLKAEAPNIVFDYERGLDKVEKAQTELMQVLSMGEKRALYLLQLLFDVEILKEESKDKKEKILIVVDDIADSFDYKNKYAIIEYLKEISDYHYFDLLILTHNFDFYRTISSRIGIPRENSFIVQRNEDDSLSMTKFGYRQDVFKKMVVDSLASGKIGSDINKLKWLLAAIPFFRNISEYTGNEDVYIELTQLLHHKDKTTTITISELWEEYKKIIKFDDLVIDKPQNTVFTTMIHTAELITKSVSEQVNLENKIILSISIRLLAESYMKLVYIEKGIDIPISNTNQTREWFDGIKSYLGERECKLLEQVNMVTPENIHINAFMYEPIIDLSDWHLKKLFLEMKKLNQNFT